MIANSASQLSFTRIMAGGGAATQHVIKHQQRGERREKNTLRIVLLMNVIGSV